MLRDRDVKKKIILERIVFYNYTSTVHSSQSILSINVLCMNIFWRKWESNTFVFGGTGIT